MQVNTNDGTIYNYFKIVETVQFIYYNIEIFLSPDFVSSGTYAVYRGFENTGALSFWSATKMVKLTAEPLRSVKLESWATKVR